MSGPTQDDLERLANRLALLASDDGEADNAGRAVGQLAKRLGLSGGDLKQMFLAGAGTPIRRPEPEADREEVAVLRRQVRDLETLLRVAHQEREAVQAELTGIKLSKYRARASRGPQLLIIAFSAVVVLTVGVMVALYGPTLSGPPPGTRGTGAAVSGPTSGVVRGRSAIVYREPDRMAMPVITLSAGAQVVVRRMVWNSFSQWAEVEVPGATGYMIATDLELR